jgi:hypothetical protein
MGFLRLVATLTLLATAFSLLGMAGCANAGRDPWVGLVAGGAVGLYLGLAACGMVRGGLLDVLFPPEGRAGDPADDHDERNPC